MGNQLTVFLPTCLSKELFISDNKSADARMLIESFFEVNIEYLLEFTCEKPDFKITSINIKEYRTILDNLVNLKIFTSKSEALRFIMLHIYLNQKNDNRKQNIKYNISVKKQVLNKLDTIQWKSIKEIKSGLKSPHNYIYRILIKLEIRGKVEKRYEKPIRGRTITLWRLSNNVE